MIGNSFEKQLQGSLNKETMDGDQNEEIDSKRSLLASASEQQVDEMLQLLRQASDNDKVRNISQGNFQVSQVNASWAYHGGKNFFQKLPSLPVKCHPIRKWVGKHRIISACVAATVILISFSGASNFHTSPLTGTTIPSGEDISGIMSNFQLGATKDKTLYFNTGPGVEGKALPLPKSVYPDGGAAICMLVSNNDKDTEDIQVALASLEFLRGDADLPSPVLVFNEGDLSMEQMEAIVSSTRRPIAFPTVDLSSFPTGFNPEEYDTTGQPHFDVANRKPWGYYQMIRFFVTTIWEHPSIERYETIMRMDSDSCFKSPNTYLPHMMHEHIVYHSQYVGVEPEAGKPYIEGLFDFTVEYMSRVNKTPGNMMLWHFIESTWTSSQTLPVFRTNLEVSKKSYMKRVDVQKWHNTLTEEEPFGLFRYRWGDAITRYIEAAVFGTDDTVLTIRHEGYYHKHGCSVEEVEDALNTHNL